MVDWLPDSCASRVRPAASFLSDGPEFRSVGLPAEIRR